MARVVYISPDGQRYELDHEEAMRRHAEDGFVGRIIPKEQASEPALASGGERSEEQAAREQAAQLAQLKAAGLTPNREWFTLGTDMIQAGKDKFKSYAKEFEALPPVEEEYPRFAERIKAERRTTTEVDASALRMDVGPNGINRITRTGKFFLEVEENFLGQFCERFSSVLPRAKSLMLALDPDVRATVFNSQVKKLKNAPEKERKGMLHYRVIPGRDAPSAFAVTGPGYVSVSSAKLAEEYAQKLSGTGARGQIDYNVATTKVIGRFQWHAPEEFDAHVNDVFRAGGVWTTSDAGDGAHKLRGGVTRIVCVNCTVVELSRLFGRQIHKGRADSFLSSARGAIGDVAKVMTPFREAWAKLRQADLAKLKIVSEEDDTVITDPVVLLRGLAKSGQISKDVARDAMVEALLTSFEAEPGETVADLVNAVTRSAAHGGFDPYERLALESAAGEMMEWMAQRVEAERPKRLALAIDPKTGETVAVQSK